MEILFPHVAEDNNAILDPGLSLLWGILEQELGFCWEAMRAGFQSRKTLHPV